MATFFLVTIHPFGDGNGRVSRKGFAAELNGINNFIKTKLNRLVYRNTMVTAVNLRVSKRRPVLNSREYNLLRFLLDQTEPDDPFAENSSRQIPFSELVESLYVKSAYHASPSAPSGANSRVWWTLGSSPSAYGKGPMNPS